MSQVCRLKTFSRGKDQKKMNAAFCCCWSTKQQDNTVVKRCSVNTKATLDSEQAYSRGMSHCEQTILRRGELASKVF